MSNENLEKNIGYSFKSDELLENALIHSSYAGEVLSVQSNERLEFLGDAVLETIISEELYLKFPNLPEGRLSVMRAYIVCEKSLAELAAHIQLGEYLKFGVGEKKAGGKRKNSILADAVEALIGAIFLDSGYETVKSVVLRLLEFKIKEASCDEVFEDYKSRLQVHIQKNGNATIEYVLEGFSGKPNSRQFRVSLFVNGKKLAEGIGQKKKQAEQAAAKSALERIL